MRIILIRIFSIVLRLICFNSNVMQRLKGKVIFDSKPFSFESAKNENFLLFNYNSAEFSFMNRDINIVHFNNNFQHFVILKLVYIFEDNYIFGLLILSLIDVYIAKFLTNFKKILNNTDKQVYVLNYYRRPRLKMRSIAMKCFIF